MKEIPWKDPADFIEEVSLDNVTVLLNFQWNSRGKYWSMNIYQKDQTPILLGCKLVVRYELIEPYVDMPLPPGAMLTCDTTALDRIERDSMGDKVKLIYITKDEKDALV